MRARVQDELEISQGDNSQLDGGKDGSQPVDEHLLADIGMGN